MFNFAQLSLDSSILGAALSIFLLRVIDVSLGTVRTLMITRGIRKWAVTIGFIEVTIWVVAISTALTHLDNLWTLLGYSGGFAAGTLLGMYLEDKLALGYVTVYVISTDKGAEIAETIRKANHGATELRANGLSGPVSLVATVAPRKQADGMLHLVNEIDPTAFVTVDDTRRVVRGYRRLAK